MASPGKLHTCPNTTTYTCPDRMVTPYEGMSHSDSSVTHNQRGYYDVGKGIKGARTDDELVEAIMDRKHDTVMSIQHDNLVLSDSILM